jgi:hypothetical protein
MGCSLSHSFVDLDRQTASKPSFLLRFVQVGGPNRNGNMKLSIGTFVYVNYSVSETVERVSKLGYDGIELSAASEFGRAYPANYSKEKRRELIKIVREHSLEISSYSQN